ncbi:MAG: MBL fold metallo-hydrolase [Lachnospiraceae bacterium]|nr:MBL fold metallo-hydrolase [Lachnospiraceae bacterium]
MGIGYTDLYNKITEYVGTGAMVLVYLAAVLFLLLRPKKNKLFSMYLMGCGFVLIALVNPVSVVVMEKMGYMEVAERFFWLLMTPVATAVAGSLLAENKKSLLCLEILLLLLCGKTVFTRIEFKKAENVYKIQSDAIAVSDIIMRDYLQLPADARVVPNTGLLEGMRPKAAVTEPLCEDIRMYNADLELWFVRNNFGNTRSLKFSKLADLLSESNSEIPVKKLAKYLDKRQFQYVVLGDWQTLTGRVDKYSFESIGHSGGYTVYKYTPRLSAKVRRYADVEGYQCMSYLLKTVDGKVIVVDGGRAWQSLDLVEKIEKNGGRVDAWIITHPHDDHCGVLASILEAEWDKSRIEIGEIYVGQWDTAAVEKQGLRVDSYHYFMDNLAKRDNVMYLKAGDEVDVCGLTMKVLHTCNDTVIQNSDNILNDGSMVFKLSGKKRSILFLGDIADNSEALREKEGITDEKIGEGSKMGKLIADEILANYPDDVKSTYVQMAHHGNCNLPDYFYEAVAPKKALFDAPDWLMENRNKETGETSYYTTPHYKALMESLGAKIDTFSEKHAITLY